MTESSSRPESLSADPENLVAAAASSAPTTPGHEPRGYVPALAGANFGIYVALLTPVMVSMAFKVQHLSATTAQATADLGLVLGVGAIFALVANPLAGRLSDRTTSSLGMRRPWIIGGVVVGFLALGLIGIASSIWIVLVGWCIAQTAMNAVLAAANATLPDQVPTERRGKASGLVGITTPLGILAGSLIVNFLSNDQTRFIVPGALALVLCLLFGITLKNRKLTQKPAHRFTVGQFFGSFLFNPVKHPDFGWAWITKFLIMFGYAGIATFLPYYLTESFGLSEQEAVTTILLANIASTGAMVISSPLSGILSDRIGRRRIFVTVAGIVMVIGLVTLSLAPTIPLVILAQGIIGLGAGSFFSVDLALTTQVLPNPEDTAKDLGVLNIANAIPQSIAPAIAPTIIGLGAMTPLGGYATWYLFGSLVALCGALLVYRIKSVK
ncbi:MFS transporter [Brachybacterium sp. MASK1Z-5]|uniref:MFS transporter n=1 Tax=Brachybacterium halotolerans TaxID=2795215 RepID=A0ABS1B8F8_9MICO|nr:MFS transporter [Brachybacterium halotolerans]MBK0330928.1 MFS transporter [Brachybacterium halotolerans]